MLDEAFNDDDDDDEAEKARALVAARGRSIIALGISISVDELIVGFTIGYSQYFSTAEAITAIVVQSFLALMAGLYFGRKVRDGKIRISMERVSTGTKLIAGGILVTLSLGLLVGPPLASHAFPHFIHSVFPHKVKPAPAPTAVTTNMPGADG
jgi:putative Mn2+ efflux pump MntP